MVSLNIFSLLFLVVFIWGREIQKETMNMSEKERESERWGRNGETYRGRDWHSLTFGLVFKYTEPEVKTESDNNYIADLANRDTFVAF